MSAPPPRAVAERVKRVLVDDGECALAVFSPKTEKWEILWAAPLDEKEDAEITFNELLSLCDAVLAGEGDWPYPIIRMPDGAIISRADNLVICALAGTNGAHEPEWTVSGHIDTTLEECPIPIRAVLAIEAFRAAVHTPTEEQT